VVDSDIILNSHVVVPWRPPLPGCLKINWDATRDYLLRLVGIGFIVRDSNGLTYAAGSFSLKTLWILLSQMPLLPCVL